MKLNPCLTDTSEDGNYPNMTKKRRGRPPVKKSELRKQTISLRLKTDEVIMLRKAASKHGKTLSSWVRQALMDSAD